MATLIRKMKKAASSVVLLANRTPHKNHTSAIFTTPLKISTITSNSTSNLYGKVFRTTSIPTHRHHFSSLDKKKSNSADILLRVIESEIDCAEEVKVAKVPREFAFKIEDNAGEEIITLTREYQGEEIKVTVRKLDPPSDYEEEEDQNEEESGPRCVELDVNVTKKNGSTWKFNVTVDGDWMALNTLAVKKPNASDEEIAYEGTAFSNLDVLLQESFRTYLVDRGIEPSTAKFLHDYMVNKEHMEYIAWLKNLKNFIAN